jgi:hypothetical protein
MSMEFPLEWGTQTSKADVQRGVAVPGAAKYTVTDHGRVYRLEEDFCGRDRIWLPGLQLKLRKNDEGYLKVKLICDDGKRRDFFVHRLVLLAFRPEEYLEAPEPNKLQACHKDRNDRTNCRLDNLYWGTHAQNHADKVAAGTHKNGCVRKLTWKQVVQIRRSQRKIAWLSDRYSISVSHVRSIRNLTSWSPIRVGNR